MTKLYRKVELTDEEHCDFVFPHLMAMTGEKLNGKAEIANELGVRDKLISERDDTIEKLKFAIDEAGPWLSAAQEDPGACKSCKDVFFKLLEANG
tara:strand:+ start:721 stop:1005 length:285 start_codon:yes stop_codon:yes gene_type:complete